VFSQVLGERAEPLSVLGAESTSLDDDDARNQAAGFLGKKEIQAEFPVGFTIRQSRPHSEPIVHIGPIISRRGLNRHTTSHSGRRKEKPEAWSESHRIDLLAPEFHARTNPVQCGYSHWTVAI
jgi:hypothetical protein